MTKILHSNIITFFTFSRNYILYTIFWPDHHQFDHQNHHQLSFIANGEEALVQIATSSPRSFPGLRRLLSLFFSYFCSFPFLFFSFLPFLFAPFLTLLSRLVAFSPRSFFLLFLFHVPCSCSFPVPFIFMSCSLPSLLLSLFLYLCKQVNQG